MQQIGTPHEIYERPVNMFVASFLGNPPINYLKGELARTGDELHASAAAQSTSLVPSATWRTAERLQGRPVCIGLRAEDVDERGEPPGQTCRRGRVTSVLPIGSDQFLGMELEGEELFFRVGKDLRLPTGEVAALAVDVNRLHVFDPDSGQVAPLNAKGCARETAVIRISSRRKASPKCSIACDHARRRRKAVSPAARAWCRC